MKFLGLIFIVLFGCTNVQKQEVKPLPTPVVKAVVLSWEKDHPERSAWSVKLKDEIAANMGKFYQAKDMNVWCPNFSKLNEDMQIYAWAELFVKVAHYESGFNPKSKFQEPPPLNVASLGLYQLSYEDKMGHCNMDKSKQTLFDPLENIKCAVGQAAKLVAKDFKVASYPPPQGMARYWSVMRATKNGSKRPSFEGIKAHMEGLGVCK